MGFLQEETKKGWRGTVRAMLSHHPEKFGDEPGKLNPWAIAHSMANKGAEPHYKDQESSLEGTPHKKKKFKDEDKKEHSLWHEWLEARKAKNATVPQ